MSEDSAEFWRDVQSVVRKELEAYFQPTGVVPNSYAGHSIDRFGRVTYSEARRGIYVKFGTTVTFTNVTAVVTGTVAAGTADIQYNDGSAFWSTANPTRFTPPTPGRYFVGAYIQDGTGPGTASVSGQISIRNNTPTYLIVENWRGAGPASAGQGGGHMLGYVVELQSGAYVEVVVGGNQQVGSVDISFYNMNFVMERIN